MAGQPEYEVTQEIIDKVRTLASQGMYKKYIASALGICMQTFLTTERKNLEFFEAYKKGKAEGIDRVTKALLNNVDLGNVTAQIFYLKCQADWKESRDKKEKISEQAKSLVESIIDKL